MGFRKMDKLKQATILFQQERFSEALEEIKSLDNGHFSSQNDYFEFILLKAKILEKLGQFEESLTLAKKVLQLTGKENNPLIAIKAYLILGEVYRKTGEYNKGLEEIIKGEQRLENIREKGKPIILKKQKASLYFLKGRLYRSKGELELALQFLHSSLKIQKEINDPNAIGSTLNVLGITYWYKGELDKALRFFKNGLTFLDKETNKGKIAYIYVNIGSIYGLKGELNDALTFFKKGLKLCQEVGDTQGEASSLHNIGAVLELKGELDLALEYLEKSLVLKKQIGNKRYIASSLATIALIQKKKGNLTQAFNLFQKTFTLYKNIGNNIDTSEVLLTLIDTVLEMSHPELAKEFLSQLETLMKEGKNKIINLRYRLGKALILKNEKKTETNLRFSSLYELVKKVVKSQQLLRTIIQEEVVDHQLTTKAIFNLCELLILELRTLGTKKVLQEISQLTQRLLEIGQEQSSYSLLAKTYLLQGNLALLQTDVERGRTLLKRAEKIAEEKGFDRLAVVIVNQLKRLEGTVPEWLLEENVSLLDRLAEVKLEGLIVSLRQDRVELYPEGFTVEQPTKDQLTVFAQELQKRKIAW
ncbi:MAG: tetratricopeptide repeat protein [Candidatus Heimdallarchaeota archaeon]|nr:tetratricopeptide repeat protein [Candidatus Heimdallarchaeota archaeon]